jgi:hypothetical protein
MLRIVSLLFIGVMVHAQVVATEPMRESGNSVTGAFEGWFKNADGTFSLLLGYYNRNQKEELDIPIGPNNRIEPGGPDRGQPTHFIPGRGWGQFVVKVPADFGESKITWTLTANGKTTVIPAHLKIEYEVSPFSEVSVGNTPPVVRFEEGGASVQGPQGMTVEKTARVGTPLSITAFVTDDAKYTSNSGARPKVMPPAVVLHWAQYRGPSTVQFSEQSPRAEGTLDAKGFSGKATTMVTFPQPGEYMLHVQANDYSGPGGSGFQCCWSNATVRVKVSP